MAKLRWAYASVPKDCGTFTFYRNLHEHLAQQGIETFCVSVGHDQKLLWNDEFADENCHLIAPNETDLKKQALDFNQWCLEHKIDIVMPMNSQVILSAIPHLDASIKVVTRCANAFTQGYRITATYPNHLAHVVATTPRHFKDLTADYDISADKITTIPHGIETSTFDVSAENRYSQPDQPLQLRFLGRLGHHQKGVLYIPPIVKQLNQHGINFELQIGGVGIDGDKMQAALKNEIEHGQVRFIDRLLPEEVPAFLTSGDIFLFPSRFEGFGFTLVEAMMAGCVPIASRIDGITDFIIDEARTGYLCDIGDTSAFANTIATLSAERDKLQTVGAAASTVARQRFDRLRMATDYADVLLKAHAQPQRRTPRSWDQFKLHPAFKQGRLRWLPDSTRRQLRTLLTQIPVANRFITART